MTKLNVVKLLDLKKWNKISLCLTYALALLAFVAPVVAQSIDSETTASALSGATAGSEFGNLFAVIQSFAGVLLVIGVVVAGLLWMANKPQFAIGVLIGSAVVFGGPYLIGLVNHGLGASVSGSTDNGS